MTYQKFYYFLATVLLYFQSTIAQEASRTDKKFPVNYKENYTSSDYVYEQSEPSFLSKLILKFLQLLDSWISKAGITGESFIYFKYGFYILVAGVAIYVLAKMFFYKEGNWLFKKQYQNILEYSDDIEHIETANFDLLIQQAIKSNNYRLAIKHYYFWVLQKLGEKEIIELTNLKTNSDYSLEIEGTQLETNFQNISYYYNYVWYGEFNVNENDFEKIKPKYEQLLIQIKNE